MTSRIGGWAAQAGPAKVLAAVHALLQENRSGDRVTVRVNLDPGERTQVARLLGVAWDTSGKPITLGGLRAAIARNGGELHTLLEQQVGPIIDLPAQRAAQRDQDQAAVDAAYTLLRQAGVPAHAVQLAANRRWLERPDRAGMEGRAQALARLWSALPAQDRPVQEFATWLFHDPHALDRDQEIGRTAVRLLAAAAARPEQAAEQADTALTAAAWRTVWAGYGVNCDAVSATVLALAVPLTGSAPAAVIATAAADCAEPVWLTGRSLRADGWAPADGLDTVRVCENPSIVEAAADRLKGDSLPLVCIYGRPSWAAWLLLRGLAAAGVRLLVTADRDNAGRQFLAEMLTLPGAAEWLPDVDGVYEESRMDALIEDLRRTA